MSNKVFISVLAVLVVALGAVFVFSGDGEAPTETSDKEAKEILAIDEQNYRVKGPADATVEVVEFADFGCGFCAQASPEVSQLLVEYDGKIQYEFKPFSIPAGQNSVVAHRAAEAAGKQDKFFAMHDLLYAQQQVWGQSTKAKQIIDSYAEQIELDMDQYQSDFKDSATLAVINDSKSEGVNVGVSGTPAFFVNGELVETQGQYYQALAAKIDEILAE